MICNVCDGSGTILKINLDFEYWPCPACCGAGVRVQHGPAFIGPGTRRKGPRGRLVDRFQPESIEQSHTR